MDTNLCHRITLILVILIGNAFGQNVDEKKETGIYLSEKDYANNVISFLATTDKHNGLVEQLGTIVVVRNGEKQKYPFGIIYGYYHNGYKYRSFESQSRLLGTYGYYKVIDDSGLIVYSKPSRNRRSNGYLFYYYSNTPVSPIMAISKKNIKRDFKERPRFVQLVSKSLYRREYIQRVNGRLVINEIYLSEPPLN
jgi:hypothetical protein